MAKRVLYIPCRDGGKEVTDTSSNPDTLRSLLEGLSDEDGSLEAPVRL